MTTTLTNRSRTTDETPGARARALLVAAGPETQAALESWFVPILIVGAVTFAFGTVLSAVAVARAASFQSVAALVALLPLAVAIGAARQGAGTR